MPPTSRPGMLEALRGNAARLGLDGATPWRPTPSAARSRTRPSTSCFGHAVLHHLPDLDQAFREFKRVLRPGGTFVFAGEPSRHGDRIARVPEARRAIALAPVWRALMRARPRGHDAGPRRRAPRPRGTRWSRSSTSTRSTPAELRGLAARAAGWTDVRVRGEELLANWFGWANRTLEATAEPDDVPVGVAPVRLPRLPCAPAGRPRVLEPRLPPAIFYNLMISAARRHTGHEGILLRRRGARLLGRVPRQRRRRHPRAGRRPRP